MTTKKSMGKTPRPAVRKRVTFILESTPGKVVAIAGSFNGWLPEKQLTDKKGDGIYTGILMLEPGTYEYKLVIDGEWRLDESNPNFSPNDMGSLNSVLVVEEK